eukprot:TRINITY_DN15272_c0_g1_i1.p1 TRINITY_DN15272_c0_g1~~TRINITY_DN15272_c0_g1_i1.p1  ORF type:complete len:528 (-),score=79.09 TRINITY_DN15272_c0_g1_i1:606-2189(-)
MGTVTSDEVNFLVYRYLQESGFQHAAFTFANEAMVSKSNINGANVPAGALVSFLQKGLQYLEVETHVREDGAVEECGESFALCIPHVCKARDRKDALSHAAPADTLMDEDMDESVRVVSEAEVSILRGHTSEVFIAAWNPTTSQLASGSRDSTARIWNIPSGPCGPVAAGVAAESSTILRHSTEDKDSKDVTTLDWNPDGSLLATGSYDGQARVWTNTGELKTTLARHKGPVFSLKWNKMGDMLLSGSFDRTAIIWSAVEGRPKQEFQFHSAPTLDVDWRDNTSFASCSTDRRIFVCKLGMTDPLKCFEGHQDEVNAVKWDPAGNLLASCSDDFTTKIWSVQEDHCIYDLTEHKKEIYTIKWSPTGPETANPNLPPLLASASFDATIKLWEMQRGVCVHSLSKHVEPVYSIAFSPNGLFLASGSFDHCLHIWSVKDGSLIKTYRGGGGIFEVCWNPAGNKVGACFSNNTVAVVDFRVQQEHAREDSISGILTLCTRTSATKIMQGDYAVSKILVVCASDGPILVVRV